MKSIALFFSCFCSALVFAQGRTETLNIEIGRSAAVSLTATEETDTTVNVVVKSGRMDYDLTGWRGVLWYGVQGSGLAVTNTSTSYNVFTFDLPTSKIPTNGLYELQVFGVTTNRTEEWARGRMSVRLNPSKGSLPPEWSSYPSFYGPMTNRISALESKTNLLNTVYSWGDHGAAGYMFLSSWLSWLGTNTYVKAETDSIALSALATNKTLRLFDPSDVNRYIDGAGNKCVISNFYTMTFSADFKNVYGNPPPQSSYVFTNSNYEAFYYTLSSMPYNYWRFERTELSGFFIECHIGLGWMQWLPTTNQYVLTVSNSPEYGTAFITHTATTNVIDSVVFSSGLSRYLTNEVDRVSLRAWHYGSSDIVESPSSWFTFSAEWQTITAYVNPANGADVVIPWAIEGVEVKWIGSSAFKDASINSVIAPKTLTSLDPDAFKGCTMKTAVFPSVSYIDEQALDNCFLLNSITWGSDAPDVEEIDYLFTDSNIVTNYVNSLTAVGWGDTFGGRPVIRMGINTGSLTLGGVTKSAWPAASSGVPSIWTNMTWGAAGTNATYRMFWDATNGTFAVEEILP